MLVPPLFLCLLEVISAISESAVNTCLLFFIPINKLTMMACLATTGGLYFFFHGLQLFARRRSLGSNAEALIRDASLGPVAVSGMAIGPHTLSSPISAKTCYLYQTTVWQRNDSERKDWQKVAEETLHLPFFVEDSTGQLLVEPLGAEIDLRPGFQEEYGGSFAPPSELPMPQRVVAFLTRYGVDLDRPIRVEERWVQPETPIFVAGTLTENPGIRLRPFSPGKDRPQVANTCRESAENSAETNQGPEVIRLSSGPLASSTKEMTQQGKIAAALTRAGITKPEAWAAAGVPYQSVAVEEHPLTAAEPATGTFVDSRETKPEKAKRETVQGFEVAPPLVVMKDANNPIFVISSRSQSELISSLGWKSVALVCFGPLLTVLGVYVLLLEWHLR